MSADIAANEIDKLRNEIARLKGQTNWVCSCGGTDCEGQKENADLHDTLDAVIEADGRAADQWRAAHPGRGLVIPDRVELVKWLLEQNAELRKDKERLEVERCECLRTMDLALNSNEGLREENAALRATAVEACALARVRVTVWGDKLSAESIKRLAELEKQILKELKP